LLIKVLLVRLLKSLAGCSKDPKASYKPKGGNLKAEISIFSFHNSSFKA